MEPRNNLVINQQEQLEDDDIDPILRTKKQEAQSGRTDISDHSRELKILWAQWDSLNINQGTLH